MTDDRLETFGGYGLAIRTHWITISELSLTNVWVRAPRVSERHASSVLSGTALSKDGVGIIGEAGAVKSFKATLHSDFDKNKEWQWSKGNIYALTPEHPFRKFYEQFDADPPTAVLAPMADPDLERSSVAHGFLKNDLEQPEPKWFVECLIADDFFTHICESTTRGDLRSLTMGIRWVPGLIFDKHTPAQAPALWGLWREPGKKYASELRGYVEHLSWDHSARQGVPGTKGVAIPPQPASRS